MEEIEDKVDHGICLSNLQYKDVLENPQSLKIGLKIKYPKMDLQWGDTLWVKEPWQFIHIVPGLDWDDFESLCAVKPDPTLLTGPNGNEYNVLYRYLSYWDDDLRNRGIKWLPAVTMPKWACRFKIEYKDKFYIIKHPHGV